MVTGGAVTVKGHISIKDLSIRDELTSFAHLSHANGRKEGRKARVKKKSFYVMDDVWNRGLTGKDKLVFVYLSSCADKRGCCFPSITRIARECGFSVSSARRALRRLESAGMIEIEPRFSGSEGSERQTSNLYRLMGAKRFSKPEAAPKAGFQPEQTPAPRPRPAPKRTPDPAEEELGGIIDRLELECLGDGSAARAVELAIRDMWRADGISVKGERVPRAQVRERVRLLDHDCAEDALYELGNCGELINARAYLIACLYNAPAQGAARLAAFKEQRRILDRGR